MALYYANTLVSNDSGDGLTPGTAKKFISSAIALMSSAGGDQVILANGTYSNTQFDSITRTTTFPNGGGANAAYFNVVRANTTGGVRITADIDTPLTLANVKFQGLIWDSANQKNFNGRYLYIKDCGIKGGPATNNVIKLTIGTNDANTTDHITVEDCWVWGDGGRYDILVYNAYGVILRRVVTRHDGAWTDSKGDPEASITLYNANNCIIQNSIVVDSTLSYHTWQSAFYSVYNSASYNSNANNKWQGVIAYNNIEPGNNDGASLRYDGNVQQANQIIEHAVFWDTNWGINCSYASPVDISANNLTIGKTTSAGTGYGIGGGSGGNTTFRNAIITNMPTADLSGESATYFDTYNNGTTSSGTGQKTYNPRTNGLLYLPRIEANSNLSHDGSSSGQIGASILYKYGVDGTFYGDPNCDVLTANTLWPWRNEDLIKLNFGEDATANARRGFANTTNKQLNGTSNVTLTSYIWEALGNQMPNTIYSATPVITGGTSTPAQNSTATITGTGFGASQGTGSLVVGGVTQVVTSWGDTSISYTVNRGINLNGIAVNAVVTNDTGGVSNSYSLTGGFTSPSGWYYITLAEPNANLQLRLTATQNNDISFGDQVEWNDANVTVYDDATFSAANTVSSFLARVGVTGYGWSAPTTETINSRVLTASTGTITITRNAANLLWAHKLVSSAGTITITGIAANFARVAPSATGSIIITGISANFARVAPSATGVITITGNTANLLFGHKLSASTGTIVITGNAANLVTGGTNSYTLTAATGSINVALKTATFSWGPIRIGANTVYVPGFALYDGRNIWTTPSITTANNQVASYYVIVVSSDDSNPAGTPITVTDSYNNTYWPVGDKFIVAPDPINFVEDRIYLFKSENGNGGPNHNTTITFAAANGSAPFEAMIYFGEILGGSNNPFDLFLSGRDNATPFTANVGPTNANNELIVSFIDQSIGGTTGPQTENSGYKLVNSNPDATEGSLNSLNSKYVSTIGTYGPSYTVTGDEVPTADKGLMLFTLKQYQTVGFDTSLSASTGSFVISGAANLIRTRIFTATKGTILVTGVAASLKRSLVLSASTGAIVITGNAAILTKSGSYTLLGGVGSITITGISVNFNRTYNPWVVDAGSINITGIAITPYRTWLRLGAIATGLFSNTGNVPRPYVTGPIDTSAQAMYGGNTYIVIVSVGVPGESLVTVTDSQNNHYDEILSYASTVNYWSGGATTGNDHVFIANNAIGNSTLTITVDHDASINGSSNVQGTIVHFMEFKNTLLLGALDSVGNTRITTGTFHRHVFPTTTSNNELLVATEFLNGQLLSARPYRSNTGFSPVYQFFRDYDAGLGGGPDLFTYAQREFTTGNYTSNTTPFAASDGKTGMVFGVAIKEFSPTFYSLSASAGTVIISGVSANTSISRKIFGDTGAITINGVAANLLNTRKITSSAGAIIIGGVSANFAVTMPANTGTFTIGGVAANFLIAHRLTATAGTIVINGNAINLLDNRILTASAGAIIITRNAAGTFKGRTVIAANGTITINGVAAGSIFNHRLTASTGVIVITGVNATLARGPIMTASAGAIVITRNAATLSRTKSILASAGSLIITGNSANLLFGHRVISSAGSIVISGTNIFIGRSITITSAKGTIVITGVPATMIYNIYRTYTSNGTILLSGTAPISRGKSANGSGTVLVSGSGTISKGFYPITTTHPLVTIGKDSLQNYFFKKFLVNVNCTIRHRGNGLNEVINKPITSRHVRNHVFTNGGKSTVIMSRFKTTKVK